MAEVMEISLNDQGHIQIPSRLQNLLGLTPGMTLVVEKDNQGKLFLRTQEESAPTIVEKQGILVIRAKPLADLSNVIRQERDQRLFELLQRVS